MTITQIAREERRLFSANYYFREKEWQEGSFSKDWPTLRECKTIEELIEPWSLKCITT